MTVSTALFNRLKEGSVKNIVFFGDSDKRPAPPYCVIKEEARDGGVQYRLITHFALGTQDALDAYTRGEISELLTAPLSVNGRAVKMYDTGQWFGVVLGNDDKTIAAERLFFIPFVF
jgi:hypothetical protein